MSPKDLREGKAPPKDANDALRQGIDLKKIVAQAQPIPHKEIMTFMELRDQVSFARFLPHHSPAISFYLYPSPPEPTNTVNRRNQRLSTI